jgi:hypothetical protein
VEAIQACGTQTTQIAALPPCRSRSAVCCEALLLGEAAAQVLGNGHEVVG